MSNLVKWAESELDRIGGQEDEIQQIMNKGVLDIVKLFAEQGHSGFSAPYAIGLIQRLLDWKPITALTGEDDEWGEPYGRKGDTTQQNKRCSEVFRTNYDNLTAYHINGKIFSDDGGETWFTNRDSFVSIEFPFFVPDTPERVILNK